MISVVIPTRNRPLLLTRLLTNLVFQTKYVDQIIVIDSSDSGKRLHTDQFRDPIVNYIITERKSAAVQRNLGMDLVSNDCKYLFFLDDDVLPGHDYFERLTSHLKKSEVVGVSGLAINPTAQHSRRQPTGFIGFVHRFFLLDSNVDGKLLASGVNIPVRIETETVTRVDWLIGCSAWNFSAIKDLRFEYDFDGQSLGEDVIFSVRASRRGTLITDPGIVLAHDESELGRAVPQEHWEMWMQNRWRLIDVMGGGFVKRFFFWWASLGQLSILLVGFLRVPQRGISGVKGIVYGALKVRKRLI